MLALLQRVTHASVSVDNQTIGAINKGILVFLAIERQDTETQASRLIERILSYRIFPDENDRMNYNIKDANGGLLIVPQFTLAADTAKGTRPSFTPAADPALGEQLFNYFVSNIKKLHTNIATGQFGANMQVSLCNDGPVTFIFKAN